MRILHLDLTLTLAVIGTARPVEDDASHPPAFVNITSLGPAKINSGSSEDLGFYPILKVYTEPHMRRGHYWQLSNQDTHYAVCMTWSDADQVGGISSMESFHDQQGLPYFCLHFKEPGCKGNILWWKGVMSFPTLDADWDNAIHSSQCHHGLSPWVIPDPNGGSVQIPNNGDAQEITSVSNRHRASTTHTHRTE